MTRPTVLFGDTVAAVIAVLEAQLTAPVRHRIPNPRPDTLVVVSDTGGGYGRTRVSEKVQVSVDCWGETVADAHDLAQSARYHIETMEGTVADGIPIYKVEEVARPSYQPDLLTDTARYVFTVAIHVRGATVPAT
jgi:hypothetical protein